MVCRRRREEREILLERESLVSLRLNGVKVNYFFICQRKLWLFDRGVHMERNSDRVFLGKLLDEESFPRKRKRITIDDLIAIDILDDTTVYEVKYSRAFEKASKMQLGYYLYYLRKLGIEREGILSYPRLRKREKVILADDLIREIETALLKIQEVLASPSPPLAVRKPYCSACSYFEFCFG